MTASAEQGLVTPRLRLRQWQESDRAPFAALTADPEVMRHFPAPLTTSEANALLDRLAAGIAERGWGFWAVELQHCGSLIGFTGLSPALDTHFPDSVEIGWRLARAHWGQGYAPEAARHCLAYAFESLQLPEVVAYTTLRNFSSMRVMTKIGMRDCERNFMHPKVDRDSPLCEHVLYKITQQEYREATSIGA